MSSRRSKGGLLARVNFPLYTVQMITNRHILVGGGGGSSKTGVANGFEIFELSHNGTYFVAEEVTRHETGPNVVMNCASYRSKSKTWIVAGQESHCQLYNSKLISENEEFIKGPTAHNLRCRKNSEKAKESQLQQEKIEEIKNNNFKSKKLQLVLEPADSIQTTFGNEEPLQRVVRVSPCGSIMATGGTDGKVRLWKFPQLEKLYDFDGHGDDYIDDIDFNPNGSLLVSIAKGKAFVWDIKSKKSTELSWKPPDGIKYMYKKCRFRGLTEEVKNDLFMLTNATTPKKNPSFLQLWDINNGVITKSVPYKETLSALAVSSDGKFVAVGTMTSGSVDIFVAFSLRKALHVPGAHRMFVTGLEFLPTDDELNGVAITSNTETAVVSISVDNRICIHSIPFRHTLPFWFVILLIVLCICGAFIFCSYLGI
ncbi:Prolactin regulatory element-binding protein [Camponotus floridanus]|uniref:Prolactin regulatory element-binding protein n=1 Tax=Camponotus floridanus TaxID=104421 RepID=E2AJN9_CAMFO|nr:prolactin regulatory element-binding protein [Camponotus floridanus]EFN66349.1 Prolactin regulatory element-binding protein [Camponotus floridanus]